MRRVLAAIDASTRDDELVERDASGLPVAFRIWRPGDNPTDRGTHRFTAASAKALEAQQARRGNQFAIDVDHLSLSPTSAPESRKAVGWHRLEVRSGALWAIDVVWTDTVRPGLTSRPPEWRYFSPAYDVDPATGEIVAYLNTAITNNPATWSPTALATRTARTAGALPTDDALDVRELASLRSTVRALARRVDAIEAARAHSDRPKPRGAVGLPPAERAALAARMGLVPTRATTRREGNTLVLGALIPDRKE